MDYEVQPVEGESYEGRDWGFVVTREGEPYLHATTGGTGDCWNVAFAVGADNLAQGDDPPLHICDLDAFIAALEVLRTSPAHKAHIDRWSA